MTLLKIISIVCLTLFFSQTHSANAALNINQTAPDFSLTDINGNTQSLEQYRGKFVVIEWFNYGCPFVKKFYESNEMQKLQKAYTEKGVIWLAINSTNEKHKDYLDAEGTKKAAEEKNVAATAIFLDPSGVVGKKFHSRATPHFFIIDPNGMLVYQGAVDSIRSTKSEDITKAKNYVALALNEALQGKPITIAETNPYGCSVKYN